jgi:YD repeat-containing protein
LFILPVPQFWILAAENLLCLISLARKVEVFVFLKRCVLLFSLGVLHSVLAPGAAAQIGPGQPNGCFIYLSANDLGIDMGAPVPPGAVLVNQNTVPGEGGLSIYRLTLSTCPPPAAPIEICLPCLAATAGQPINLATGNTYIHQTDVKVPGLSGGLSLVRAWNSKWPSTQSAFQVGLFGPNWRSTYEERIFVGSDDYIKYARGDGSFWSFGFSSGVYKLAAPQNTTATLATGSAYWTLTFQSGEQRRFDNNSGSLIAIIDRNGNTTQLTYDALNRLVTVTDPASRHLTFTYGSPSSYLVTGVSSDVGLALTYSYDTQNRLSQVTNPDLTTLTFGYDSQSRIISVTDSNNKVLESHTYDSNGRGLTSSRALGVDAVTITYPIQ